MRKRISAILLTGGAAAVALGLSATTALAATSLTVVTTGGGTITASAATTTLKDGSTSVTCSTSGGKAASTASATVKNATTKGNAPLKIGTATKLAFNNCTGPLGAVTVKVNKEPYALNANSTTNSAGETDATVSGVNTSVSMTDCTFTVTGSAPGYYNNSKHTLNLTSTLPVKADSTAQLTISNVNGCLGQVHNGDHPSYTSTYTTKPATLQIKST